ISCAQKWYTARCVKIWKAPDLARPEFQAETVSTSRRARGRRGEVHMGSGFDRTMRLTASATANGHTARAGPAKLVIVTRHELTAAGIEALVRAGGHRVLARLTPGDDLLRVLESTRPDTLLLSVIRREAVRLTSLLRADHPSISVILMLEERDV